MKDSKDLTHYALFEIPTDASTSQIKKSYELLKKTYGIDSMATYSLLDNNSRNEILDKIEKAYSVLGSEMRRKEYDLQIGIQQTHVGPILSESKPSKSVKVDSSEKEKDSPEIHSQTRTSDQQKFVDLSEQEIKGSILKEIRERQGIPLQEIAEETRINITYLQYIESDRYKSLPAEVYLKGYLEQYTKFIGLDPTQVIEKFLERVRAAQ